MIGKIDDHINWNDVSRIVRLECILPTGRKCYTRLNGKHLFNLALEVNVIKPNIQEGNKTDAGIEVQSDPQICISNMDHFVPQLESNKTIVGKNHVLKLTASSAYQSIKYLDEKTVQIRNVNIKQAAMTQTDLDTTSKLSKIISRYERRITSHLRTIAYLRKRLQQHPDVKPWRKTVAVVKPFRFNPFKTFPDASN